MQLSNCNEYLDYLFKFEHFLHLCPQNLYVFPDDLKSPTDTILYKEEKYLKTTAFYHKSLLQTNNSSVVLSCNWQQIT